MGYRLDTYNTNLTTKGWMAVGMYAIVATVQTRKGDRQKKSFSSPQNHTQHWKGQHAAFHLLSLRRFYPLSPLLSHLFLHWLLLVCVRKERRKCVCVCALYSAQPKELYFFPKLRAILLERLDGEHKKNHEEAIHNSTSPCWVLWKKWQQLNHHSTRSSSKPQKALYCRLTYNGSYPVAGTSCLGNMVQRAFGKNAAVKFYQLGFYYLHIIWSLNI